MYQKSEQILPVHILKLRWLLSQFHNLSCGLRTKVCLITEEWELDNYRNSEPFLISLLDDVYFNFKQRRS